MSRVPLIRPFDSRLTSPRIEAVVFSSIILPGERGIIAMQPEYYFKPERLVYKGPEKTYRLCGFYVGYRNQFFATKAFEGVSMDFFAPGPKEQAVFEAFLQGKTVPLNLRKLLNNLGTCDFCQRSMMLSITVENVAPKTPTTVRDYPFFECVMYGEVPHEDSSSAY